ncbi:MAG: hypothetical protein ABI411_05505 [Tahibacter sp.]
MFTTVYRRAAAASLLPPALAHSVMAAPVDAETVVKDGLESPVAQCREQENHHPRSITMMHMIQPLRLGALLVLLAANSAYATTDYCVGTVAQLQTALAAAENDGDASVITLKPGSYVLSSDLDYNQYSLGEGALTLRGGAIGNCVGATPGAGSTTIAGLFAMTFIQRRGEIRIEDLRFVGMNVRVTTRAPSTEAVQINRLLMLSSLLEVNAPSSEVVVRESVFKNGTDQYSVADFGLWVDASQANGSDPESSVQLINVSVIDAYARISGTNRTRVVGVTNSIFQRTGVELESSANLTVRNSRAGNIQMQAGAVLASSNVITSSAALNAQYQPSSTSPMLDRGLSALYDGLPLFDLYGEARVVGAAIDIGAAESPSDSSGVVIVDTTASSGAGSLAAAVTFANADPAPNTIRFNIPGATCPKRIARSSDLTITDGVVIDGYSQPGSVLPRSATVFNGEPCIVLDGTNRTHNGIVTGSALSSNNESITIKGLAFEDFNLAVYLSQGSNHVLQGNQFGGSIGSSSTVMASNDVAIFVSGGGSSLIGGLSAIQGNLIVGSNSNGVQLSSDNNSIVGNQIGYDGTGIPTAAASNGRGINISGADNQILSNRIGGNEGDGIGVSGSTASGNEIRNNIIGGGVFSVPANSEAGLYLATDAHDNQIGPDNKMVGNTTGIEIVASAGGRNRISRNAIFSNTGLGIDLANAGVTANDNDSSFCSVSTGCASNNGQNFPTLASAEYRPGTFKLPESSLSVEGTLRSLVRDAPYRVEFYKSALCDASGFGEGAVFVGAIDITITNTGACTANNCTQAFDSLFFQPDGVAVGDFISAVATADNGDSSEFSQCVAVTAAFDDRIFEDGFQ